MTLADLLFEPPFDIGADEVVVHSGEDTVTHGDLVQRAQDVADALEAAGASPGSAVAVMLPNTAEVIATLFGVWRAGAVYMPINPRSAPNEVQRLLHAVRPALLVSENGIEPVDTTRPEHYPSDVALIQMTSGTTGPPKPVLLKYETVLGLMNKVVGSLRGGGTPKRSSTPNLIPVSLSLWAGIYNTCFAFLVGAPVVLMPQFETRAFAELVARHQVRSVVLPPAAMVMLADDEQVTSLEPLQWVRSITAPLSPFQARRFHDRFDVGILNSYGQTELGGEIVGWSAADWREFGETKLGAVGRPHEGVEVRAVGEELWVRTPVSVAGYADSASTLSDRLTDDGWFRTGDKGEVDEDGFVWVEGRISDQINRGGMKVTPSEVEEVLAAAPGVREAAVIGAPDDRLGEVPIAFVVPEDLNAPPTLAELKVHCREHLGAWKVPVRFDMVATLPRNEVGKVLKRELAEQNRA